MVCKRITVLTSVSGELFEILFIFNWLTYSKFPEGRRLQQDTKSDLNKNCKALEIFCFVLV